MSPAEYAGVRSDHIVLSVNNISVVSMSVEKIIALLDSADVIKLVTMPAHLYAGIIGELSTKAT